ncbi:GW dipeptide domain-containing protein [Pediococcus parvulus]|uniref:GW dipeptide domain-containing protein n=1 Tax=Pediococcus parvulus TaxID=54062 RepID=UPI00345ED529
MFKNTKTISKKMLISLLTGVTLMGLGAGVTTAVTNTSNMQTSVQAATTPEYISGKAGTEFQQGLTCSVGGIQKTVWFSSMTLKAGETKTVSMPKVTGYASSATSATFKENASGTGYTLVFNGTDDYSVYYAKVSTKKTTKKSVSVKYTKKALTKQVRLAPGHDFYNHVPGSKYATKRVHYGKTYAGKTITINDQGIKKGMKTPYYRCYYKGKLIGWIYYFAVVNKATYKTVKKTATVIATPKNNFYNHLTYSVYKTKLLHYGKTYRDRKVTINKQAVRAGTKTPYYRCYVNGKEIGWIYGGNLTNIK